MTLTADSPSRSPEILTALSSSSVYGPLNTSKNPYLTNTVPTPQCITEPSHVATPNRHVNCYCKSKLPGGGVVIFHSITLYNVRSFTSALPSVVSSLFPALRVFVLGFCPLWLVDMVCRWYLLIPIYAQSYWDQPYCIATNYILTN